MDYFNYQNNILYAEDCPLPQIAQRFGTPTYVYSRATFERHWHAFDQAFSSHPHLVCYAVKANSNLAVLNILARLGSGFDVVSGGELQRLSIVRALLLDPVFLFADEPTSRLDPLTQREVMQMLAGLARAEGIAVLLVSHDPDLVQNLSDRQIILIAA